MIFALSASRERVIYGSPLRYLITQKVSYSNPCMAPSLWLWEIPLPPIFQDWIFLKWREIWWSLCGSIDLCSHKEVVVYCSPWTYFIWRWLLTWMPCPILPLQLPYWCIHPFGWPPSLMLKYIFIPRYSYTLPWVTVSGASYIYIYVCLLIMV